MDVAISFSDVGEDTRKERCWLGQLARRYPLTWSVLGTKFIGSVEEVLGGELVPGRSEGTMMDALRANTTPHRRFQNLWASLLQRWPGASHCTAFCDRLEDDLRCLVERCGQEVVVRVFRHRLQMDSEWLGTLAEIYAAARLAEVGMIQLQMPSKAGSRATYDVRVDTGWGPLSVEVTSRKDPFLEPKDAGLFRVLQGCIRVPVGCTVYFRALPGPLQVAEVALDVQALVEQAYAERQGAGTSAIIGVLRVWWMGGGMCHFENQRWVESVQFDERPGPVFCMAPAESRPTLDPRFRSDLPRNPRDVVVAESPTKMPESTYVREKILPKVVKQLPTRGMTLLVMATEGIGYPRALGDALQGDPYLLFPRDGVGPVTEARVSNALVRSPGLKRLSAVLWLDFNGFPDLHARCLFILDEANAPIPKALADGLLTVFKVSKVSDERGASAERHDS